MKIAAVEIYSDKTNAAIMRHPDRHFPGLLLQGDTLYQLCFDADRACETARSLDDAAYQQLNRLRNQLWSLLSHYKATLTEHKLPLPFSEQPT